MDNEQNMNTNPEPVSEPQPLPSTPAVAEKKNLPLVLLILGAVAVAGGILYWLQDTADLSLPSFTPRPEATPLVDAEVDADLKAAAPNDPDGEFQEIDAGLNNL